MSFIVYVVAVGFFIRWMIRHKEKFTLNEESLHKQWLFRLAVIFPIISSLYFMVCLGSDYPFKHDADGYNNFLEINKFSLGILALSPILGAFVVYAHRSYQTELQIKTAKEQLEEAQKKNRIDIYFSKRKFINEQLSSIITVNDEKITKFTSLHISAFKTYNYEDKMAKCLSDEIESNIIKFNQLTLFSAGFSTLDIFSLLEDYDKNQNLIHKDKMKFLDVDFYLNNIKNIFYIEKKSSLINDYDKWLSEGSLLYKKMKTVNNEFDFEYYPNVKHGYITLYSNSLYFVEDMVNIISEIMVVLYPDEDINILLPSLNDIKNKIKDIQKDLSNLY